LLTTKSSKQFYITFLLFRKDKIANKDNTVQIIQ
jgi:hypothetical protein